MTFCCDYSSHVAMVSWQPSHAVPESNMVVKSSNMSSSDSPRTESGTGEGDVANSVVIFMVAVTELSSADGISPVKKCVLQFVTQGQNEIIPVASSTQVIPLPMNPSLQTHTCRVTVPISTWPESTHTAFLSQTFHVLQSWPALVFLSIIIIISVISNVINTCS